MRILTSSDKTLLVRLGVSVLLAIAALGLFFASRSTSTRPIEPSKKEFSQTVATEVDRGVEAVLSRFKIEKQWIRKREIPLPHSDTKRIERRVAIPPDVIPLQVNVALSTMAKQYDARAVASEDLKENTLTIHIEMDGLIVQTIILKTNRELVRPGNAGTQKST